MHQNFVQLSAQYNSRFFPNGQVLSLLANEELDPQQVIPLLKPTLRMKVYSFHKHCLSSN
jgi:F-box protein 9